MVICLGFGELDVPFSIIEFHILIVWFHTEPWLKHRIFCYDAWIKGNFNGFWILFWNCWPEWQMQNLKSTFRGYICLWILHNCPCHASQAETQYLNQSDNGKKNTDRKKFYWNLLIEIIVLKQLGKNASITKWRLLVLEIKL